MITNFQIGHSYQCRNPLYTARITGIDEHAIYPMTGIIIGGDEESEDNWCLNGRFMLSPVESDYDLIDLLPEQPAARDAYETARLAYVDGDGQTTAEIINELRAALVDARQELVNTFTCGRWMQAIDAEAHMAQHEGLKRIDAVLAKTAPLTALPSSGSVPT